LAEARKLSGKSLKDVDVAVVDLALPDGDTFGLIEHFALNEPQVMILVLSGSLEPERFARAIEAGAAGVLDKVTPIKDIIEAVRQLKDGEALIPRPEVIEMLSWERQQKQEALQAIETLSSREREILRALAEGLEDKEIAEKLNIAPNTVRHHFKAILYKLGVNSRLQALVFAARHGFVEIR
jgi:two-component system, NarL family, nitrate/nitrite response regulator NarL